MFTALLAACRPGNHTDPESLNPITEFANQEWFMAMTSPSGAGGLGASTRSMPSGAGGGSHAGTQLGAGTGGPTAAALTTAPAWFRASMMFSGPAEQAWLDFYTENVKEKWENPTTGHAFSSAAEAWRELS